MGSQVNTGEGAEAGVVTAYVMGRKVGGGDHVRGALLHERRREWHPTARMGGGVGGVGSVMKGTCVYTRTCRNARENGFSLAFTHHFRASQAR